MVVEITSKRLLTSIYEDVKKIVVNRSLNSLVLLDSFGNVIGFKLNQLFEFVIRE